MKKLILIPIVILIVFTSCKKDDPPPVEQEITDAQANDSLYYLMNRWYYWYNVMPVVNRENYDNPYELMDAMMYKPTDKWSFVADYEEFNNEMRGIFVGHGIRIGLDETNKARIAMIYSRSPLYANGVRRGWIIKKVNNTDLAQVILSGDAAAYDNVMGPSQAGITNIFVFEKPDGTEVTISSTKSTFQENSVLFYDTLHLSSGVTGHLVFESFIQPSTSELLTAFTFFKANNVKDVILDLRYNSGGYLYVAQQLASYISGNAPGLAGEVFAKLSYNDKNPDATQSSTFKFVQTDYPLNLTRLVVITSEQTASASEAVINGLRPFMTVVSIGDITSGKPVGMNGWTVGEKYYYWPITFKMVNKNNEGEYFDGIAPAKIVVDDITHDFGNRAELCLKEAIYYLENGSVSKSGGASFDRKPQFSEKPSWVTNGFTIVK